MRLWRRQILKMGLTCVWPVSLSIHPIIDFKYKDYYASTGRYDVPMAGSLAEAYSFEAPELPDLTKLQQDLMDTFPYDLWEDENEL